MDNASSIKLIKRRVIRGNKHVIKLNLVRLGRRDYTQTITKADLFCLQGNTFSYILWSLLVMTIFATTTKPLHRNLHPVACHVKHASHVACHAMHASPVACHAMHASPVACHATHVSARHCTAKAGGPHFKQQLQLFDSEDQLEFIYLIHHAPLQAKLERKATTECKKYLLSTSRCTPFCGKKLTLAWPRRP